jgi:hypothetical protein
MRRTYEARGGRTSGELPILGARAALSFGQQLASSWAPCRTSVYPPPVAVDPKAILAQRIVNDCWSPMTYTADPRVEAYIDALPAWQQAICREVRGLVHAADQEVTETIKRTNRPYFVLHGNICALLAAKDHVNVFLYDGAIVPDPHGLITAGHENKTARTVAVRQGETVNAPALTAMFEQIIANNRMGGWRKLKREG